MQWQELNGKEIKMLRKNPSGHQPQVSPKAYIDPTAIICGHVIIHDYVYVGPYAVIRADELNDDGDMEPVIIHSHSNIQDGVVIHSKSGAPVTIGSGSSIAHRAIVHGPCKIEDRVFIGFNSVLFNCHIQEGCVIRYNAVVDGVTLPEKTYIPSTERVGPDSVLEIYPVVDPASIQFSEEVASTNVKLVEGYKSLRNEF
jgi:carbonic anhydrase/acetyltransferase-like protein (isoleucine patch superfamily)